MKEKFISPIHSLFTGCGTSNTPIQAIDLDGLEQSIPDQYRTSSEGLPVLQSPAIDHLDANHPALRREVKADGQSQAPNKAEINIPPAERFNQAMRTNAVNVLKVVVADPQALKDGDLLEWASLVPIGKLGKIAKRLKPFEKAAKGAEEVLDARKLLEKGAETSVKNTPLWTATSKLSPVKNAFAHWKKHAAEFPEYTMLNNMLKEPRIFYIVRQKELL